MKPRRVLWWIKEQEEPAKEVPLLHLGLAGQILRWGAVQVGWDYHPQLQKWRCQESQESRIKVELNWKQIT